MPSMASLDLFPAMLPMGVRYFPGYLGNSEQMALLQEIRAVVAAAPLYRPVMPRSGKPLSVLMTNCGSLGWFTDRVGGYRYVNRHPVSGQVWPPIPSCLLELWRDVADYPEGPEACLVNLYAADARMGSHRDVDEQDMAAPVVSVSLGDDALFHMGGPKRSDAKYRLTLHSGDVIVLGGPSRLAYHGIDRIVPGTSGLLAEGGRLNLTLRRVSARD